MRRQARSKAPAASRGTHSSSSASHSKSLTTLGTSSTSSRSEGVKSAGSRASKPQGPAGSGAVASPSNKAAPPLDATKKEQPVGAATFKQQLPQQRTQTLQAKTSRTPPTQVAQEQQRQQAQHLLQAAAKQEHAQPESAQASQQPPRATASKPVVVARATRPVKCPAPAPAREPVRQGPSAVPTVRGEKKPVVAVGGSKQQQPPATRPRVALDGGQRTKAVAGKGTAQPLHVATVKQTAQQRPESREKKRERRRPEPLAVADSNGQPPQPATPVRSVGSASDASWAETINTFDPSMAVLQQGDTPHHHKRPEAGMLG
jgi:hypothetical protein